MIKLKDLLIEAGIYDDLWTAIRTDLDKLKQIMAGTIPPSHMFSYSPIFNQQKSNTTEKELKEFQDKIQALSIEWKKMADKWKKTDRSLGKS